MRKVFSLLIIFALISHNFIFAATPGGVGNSLKLWLKADSGVSTTTANKVTSWIDQSGNNNNVTQSDATRQPNYGAFFINFNPVIHFTQDNTSDNPDFLFKQSANLTGGSPAREIFAVSMLDYDTGVRADGSMIYLGASPAISRQNISFAVENFTNVGGVTHLSILTSGSTNADATNYHAASTYSKNLPLISNFHASSGAKLSQHKVVANGLDLGSTTPSSGDGDFVPSIPSNPDVYVGVKYSVSPNQYNYYLYGKLAELILYESELTPLERQKVSSYLALKYGITLDQSTSTDYLSSSGVQVWNSSKAGGFKSNIFGIGKDTGSSLDQRISKSVNKDAIVTISTTGDYVSSNLDSSRVSLNDGQFVVISNNGGNNSFTDLNAPDEYLILDRKWMYQNTGSVSEVYVKFDFDNPNFDIPARANYYIIGDTDRDGDFSDETPYLLTSGGEFRIDLASLPSEMVFTLATRLQTPSISVNPNAPATVSAGDTIEISGSCGNDYANGTAEITTIPASMIEPYPKSISLDTNGNFSTTTVQIVRSNLENFSINIKCKTQSGHIGPSVQKGVYSVSSSPTNISLSDNSQEEGTKTGSVIGELSASDPDKGDSHTFSFNCATPGTDDSAFEIDGNLLKNSIVFDYEKKKEYHVCIRATDTQGNTYDKDFTIFVENVSEGGGIMPSLIKKGFSKAHRNWYGCTDPNALNYSQKAVFNDGSCKYDKKATTTPVLTVKDEISTSTDNISTITTSITYPQQTDEADLVLSQSNCPYFTEYKKIGDKGDEVKKIQAFLKKYGYFNVDITGYYGRLTDQAIRKFQQDYSNKILKPWGITTPTGRWYKTTRSMANKLLGCKDDYGILEGIKDKQTIKSLDNVYKYSNENICPYFVQNLKYGDKGEEVKKVQKFLKETGLFNTDITGYFGNITKTAVSKFQKMYSKDILFPLGLSEPTGNWYELTVKKANHIKGCK